VYTTDDVRRILHPSSTEARADTAAGVDSEVVRRLRAMLGVDDGACEEVRADA